MLCQSPALRFTVTTQASIGGPRDISKLSTHLHEQIFSQAYAAVAKPSLALSGPVLLEDYEVQERLFSLNRARIPERVVHAKGAVAKGYFEVHHFSTKGHYSHYQPSQGLRSFIYPVHFWSWHSVWRATSWSS